MTCPSCGADVDTSEPIANLVICPKCLRSLAVENNALRLAHGGDTTALDDSQLAALKARRSKARKL